MDPDITTKTSPWPVSETVERFLKLLDARGITAFAVIDQAAEARRIGLRLRDTVLVVFGNPAGGTRVMDAVPLSALDLPLKLLAWDDGGSTRVSYLSPPALAARWDLSDPIAAPLGVIDSLTDVLISS